MSDDPGEGWRRLKVGERIEAGDEYLGRDGWCNAECAGNIVWHAWHIYRRRVTAATADAPPPEPKPVAWGFATPDGNLMHVSTFQPAPGTPFVVPLYAAPHPWCRDVDRDLAVRAGEDARAVTLPEWRELPRLVAELLARVAELERRSGEVSSK
jgi:hypothetical protein